MRGDAARHVLRGLSAIVHPDDAPITLYSTTWSRTDAANAPREFANRVAFEMMSLPYDDDDKYARAAAWLAADPGALSGVYAFGILHFLAVRRAMDARATRVDASPAHAQTLRAFFETTASDRAENFNTADRNLLQSAAVAPFAFLVHMLRPATACHLLEFPSPPYRPMTSLIKVAVGNDAVDAIFDIVAVAHGTDDHGWRAPLRAAAPLRLAYIHYMLDVAGHAAGAAFYIDTRSEMPTTADAPMLYGVGAITYLLTRDGVSRFDCAGTAFMTWREKTRAWYRISYADCISKYE